MVPEPYQYDSEYDSRRDTRQYPYQEYYHDNGRPPRRGGGGGGWWVLVVLVLLAVGTVLLLSRYSIEVRRTGNGMSLVIRDASQAPDESPEESQPETGDEGGAAPEATPLQPNAGDGDGPQLVLGDSPDRQVPVSIQSASDGLTLQQIYQKLLPSVVSITSTGRSSAGSGTGIIMSADGYIITNEHVVEGAVAIEILTSDDQVFSASLVGSDSTSDLAVLKISAAGLTPAEFGNSDQLLVGDAVVAIGDPLGRELRGTMTDGIISAINRDMVVNGRSMTLIQTNAALNNGNSGGPLINAYGQVIGINTMKMSSYYTSATVEGLGFAIPISSAKPIIDELIEHGFVSGRPSLGISGKTLPEVIRSYYRLPSGVYVESVDPDSDACRQGIREGDTIIAIGDTQISSLEDLNLAKNQYQAGDTVLLTVYRSGETYQIYVILGDAAA